MRSRTKSYDVVVIGAGVIGLALTRELGMAGATALLIDKGTVGREASWASAGMLAPQCEGTRSSPFMRLLLESLELYPTFARSLFDETGVDIELQLNGIVRLPQSGADVNKIYEWQRKERMAVEKWSGPDARMNVSGLSASLDSALNFPTNGQVENRKLVEALNRSCECLRSVDVKHRCRASAIESKGERVSAVISDDQRFPAQSVVITAGAWSSGSAFGIAGLPHIYPVKGQMVCLDGTESGLEHVLYSDSVYIVPRLDGRVLVGSSMEDRTFDYAVDQKTLSSFVERAAALIPKIKTMPVMSAWAGLRPKGPDEFPILGGSNTRGLFIATGHFRNGILLAPMTARMMKNLILDGTECDALTHFGVSRFQTGAGAET